MKAVLRLLGVTLITQVISVVMLRYPPKFLKKESQVDYSEQKQLLGVYDKEIFLIIEIVLHKNGEHL